jgi:uncharacterized protein
MIMLRYLRTGFLVIGLGLKLTEAEATERPVNVRTHDGFDLAGRISYPEGSAARRPGVVLIHGSGAGTMDQWIPAALTADGRPARLFQQISEALNAAGAVVLRYNKRGVKEAPDGSPMPVPAQAQTISIGNLIKDVRAAVEILRQDPAVDPHQIVLLGLSEGTVIGPMAAAQDGQIAGLIQLSSQASNLRDILYFQLVERSMMMAAEIVDADRDRQLSAAEIAAVEGFSLPIALADRDHDGLVSMQELKVILLKSHAAFVASMKANIWYQEYISLQNLPAAVRAFQGPILLLHGKADMQTPLSEFFLVEDALQGRTNVTAKTYDGLGHGFSPHKGQQGHIPTVGPIEARVMEDLKLWFQETFKPELVSCQQSRE